MFVGILLSVPTVRDKQPIKFSAVGGLFRFTRLVLISHKKKTPGKPHGSGVLGHYEVSISAC